MRIVDGTLAFPAILLALILAVVVGPSFTVVVLVITFIAWANYARLVRGETLALKQADFVSLARVAGASDRYIIMRHILPMVLNSVVVLSTLQVGWAVLVEGSLSFLGAGIPPPNPTWGGMVSDGRAHIETTWWISAFPGLAIMLVVLAFNMFGDWLRDALDPKLRQL
jgi:peptide/nickel transport system permease protein